MTQRRAAFLHPDFAVVRFLARSFVPIFIDLASIQITIEVSLTVGSDSIDSVGIWFDQSVFCQFSHAARYRRLVYVDVIVV